jgi:hypothetical protein
LDERESKLKLVESELSAKSRVVDELMTSSVAPDFIFVHCFTPVVLDRMGKLQGEFEASDQLVKSLQTELMSSRANEASEKTQRLEATREKILSEQKLITTGRRLEDVVAQAESYRKRYERRPCFTIRSSRYPLLQA